MAVARLTPTGVLDATFGAMGRNTVGFDLGGTRNDEGNGMALDAQGRIVVVGAAATSARGDDFAVARLQADGVGLLRSGRRMFGRPAR